MKFSPKNRFFKIAFLARPTGSFYKAILKNQFFGRKFHSKNLKNDQIVEVGPTFVNALYDSTTCMNTTSNCGETINSENCSPVERCECPESAPIWDVDNKVCVNKCPGVCNVEWDRDWCDANFHTADTEQLCCCGVQTCCEPDKCVHRTTTPGPTTTQATTTQATTVREILKKVGGMTKKPKIIKNTQNN